MFVHSREETAKAAHAILSLPKYDIHGDGIILTGHSELQYYLFLSMIHGDGIILTGHSELQYYPL